MLYATLRNAAACTPGFVNGVYKSTDTGATWTKVSTPAMDALAANKQLIRAAQSLGAGSWRIMSRHLLPACTGHLLVQATLLLPAFILAEATLSYIGLGFPEGVPTWGRMLSEAANINAMARFPWTLSPAVAIFLVVLGFNLLGDALRDVLEPRLRGARPGARRAR